MPSSTRPCGNLPAEATSFVGRRDELAGLRSRLATARHVSLVGPGGVGKTRLAVQIACELARRFPDGAWLVELADVESGALVSNAALKALGLRDQAASEPLSLILSYLRDKELLLVVDNCEHVLVGAARVVADIIKSAPRVRVIATSREPLGLTSEQVVPVRPLKLPGADAEYSLRQLRSNEAVSLFSDRAAAASGTFEVSAANREAVAELCRRLDGLPLALELAAVRTRVLSVGQIVDRLTDRFALLTGTARAVLPRHQTLLTTFEWSHDLLTSKEQTLLRRLCVFPGRFTLEDVESICSGGDVGAAEALNLLSSLIDKSLVTSETGALRACYRQHETIREYARLKLRERDEEAATQARFVDHYRARSQQSALEARYQLVEWLEWMDLQIDNVRSVLHRSLSRGDIGIGLEVVGCLWWYWVTRATTEGVHWLDTFLEAGLPVPATHAWPLFIRGYLAVLQADPRTAKARLRQAVEAAGATGQIGLLAHSLSMSSMAELWVGDLPAAARLLEEAEAAMESLDDAQIRLGLLQARSLHGLAVGDLEAVRSAASDGVRLSRDTGDLYALDMMLLNLVLANLGADDLDAAEPLLQEGLRIAERLDDRIAQFLWLDATAYHAAHSGRARLAAQLTGAAETLRTEAGAGVSVIVEPLLTSATRTAKAALGAREFEAQFKAGRRLTRESARDLALGIPTQPTTAPAVDEPTGALSKREAEVARLVAQGLSNKAVGSRLFITDRTVESHVRNILDKLGVSSRTEIASWVSREASERPMG
jgi:predicted ATPase/DNA-binding NarL/FixJ family response regulator